MGQKKSQETYIHRQLIFDRSAKVIKEEKGQSFQQIQKHLKSISMEKGLVPKLCKKLLKHSKKANNLIFLMGKIWNRHLIKDDLSMAN